MKSILITFGGAAYDHQTTKTYQFARPSNGVDVFKVYDDAWLVRTPFYEQNRWIFERQPQHGFGFCSWKPYIIQHALTYYADVGDVVMYLDADTYPLADLSCLFEMAFRDDIVLFEEQGCVNKTWIKGECFQAMDAIGWSDKMIACGRFQLFQKHAYCTQQFLMEWLAYSLNRRCQFHEPSLNPNLDDPTFIKNSCEQSVLSLLAAKYDIPLHRTPDQNGWPVAHNGNYKPDDTYPQLFVQVGARGNVGDLSGSRFRNVE